MSLFLIACDGSDPAERAVAMAGRHAAALGGRLVLLHVVGPDSLSAGVRSLARVEHLIEPHRGGDMPGISRLPSWVSEFRPAPADLREEHDTAQALGRQVLERAQAVAQGCGFDGAIERVLRDGSAAEEIITCAREQKADLIALGSRGLGVWRSALLGSVSTRVLHESERACLVVP